MRRKVKMDRDLIYSASVYANREVMGIDRNLIPFNAKTAQMRSGTIAAADSFASVEAQVTQLLLEPEKLHDTERSDRIFELVEPFVNPAEARSEEHTSELQ